MILRRRWQPSTHNDLTAKEDHSMNTHRKTAIVVGVLFIIATAFLFIGQSVYQPILDSSEYLEIAYPQRITVSIGILLEFACVIAIPLIPVFMFPVLRKHSETLAIGYVGIRIIEGVVFLIVAVIGLLSLLALSQEFVEVGAAGGAHFQTIGALLLSAHDWAYVIGGQVVFSVSALILNYVLFQSRLVPRFISVWGLIGAVLILAGGISAMFDLFAEASVLETVIFLPIAVQEMVLAVWLIAKGFNLQILASRLGNTQV